MLALVTGATGFIGGIVAQQLLFDGWEVRALVRPASDATALVALGAEVVRGDICDPESLPAACRGADAVVHAAALVTDWAPRREFDRVNVEGSRLIAEAAGRAGAGRLVHVSTTDVYGFPDSDDIDEDAPHRKRGWGYSDSKIDAERAVTAAAARTHLGLSIVRPGSVFGPRGKDFVAEVGDLLKARKLPLVNRGRARGGLVYGENLARAIVRAASEPRAAGRAYNVHDATGATWADYFGALADAIGAPRPHRSVPRGVAFAAAAVMEALWRGARARRRPLLTRHAVAIVGTEQEFSTQRARVELGWRPAVGFAEAVRRSAQWYLESRGGG